MHRWASEEVEYVYVCVDGCAEVNDCAAELAASLLRIRAEKSLRQSSYLQQQRAEESAAPRGGGAVVIGMLMHCVYGQMVKSCIKCLHFVRVIEAVDAPADAAPSAAALDTTATSQAHSPRRMHE